MLRILIGGFICGVLAVLVFHQGTVQLLHHALPLLERAVALPEGLRPAEPGYLMRVVPLLRLPELLVVCLFGGLWGILLAALLRTSHMRDLRTGFLFGALVCTVVGFTTVPGLRNVPLLDLAFAAAWLQTILVNGAWGWGAAGLMRVGGVTETPRRPRR